MDNEVCLAWLAAALQQLRPAGRTKVMGYLEAVLEVVVFETKMAPERTTVRSPTLRKAFSRWEEDACSGCW